MQFTSMSIWLFFGLALLTAGLLAALQYLRARPRRVSVVTTIFWQQAAEQSRARTLFGRFRHLLTYLLLLLIALLLLLALANPVFGPGGQSRTVIVLEAGIGMTATDGRFENALALVRSEAAAAGEENVAVIAADPHPRLLKHFGESLIILENRLSRLQPAEAPVNRAEALGTAESLLVGGESDGVTLVSSQPAEIANSEVRVLAAGAAVENAFILSATFVPADGEPTRGSFHCRVGYAGKQTGSFTAVFTHGEKSLSEEKGTLKPGETMAFTVPNIAADGGILTASLVGSDAIPADSTLSFRLPNRRRISVAPVDGTELPPNLASVLTGMPGVIVGPTPGADTPIIRIGPPGSGSQITIVPSETDGKMALVTASTQPLVEGIDFEDAYCPPASAPLDAAGTDLPLLLAGRSAIATISADGSRISISSAIFDDGSTLIRRTGYQVFWSNALHQLAGWRSEPISLGSREAAQVVDPATETITLKAEMEDLASVPGTAAKPAAFAGIATGQLPLWQLLLIPALALMLLEATLNLRGKIS